MHGKNGDNQRNRRQSWRWAVLGIALLLGATPGWAQNSGPVTATLRAGEDYIEVGRPFPVELEIVHPPDMVIILPDTGQDFAPYEFVARRPNPTRTGDTRSTDFVTYQLRSWSIDSLQKIVLPIAYIQNGDTQLTYSSEDTVILMPAITTPIDSLEVMYVDNLAPVREPTNWTLILIVLAGVLVLVTILVVVFYGPLQRRFRGRRIDRQYRRHTVQLNEAQRHLPDQKEYLLAVSRVWKDYLDLEVKTGLASFSTRELRREIPALDILQAHHREGLLQLNEQTDLVTYAGSQLSQDQINTFFDLVRQVIDNEYQRRKEALKK